MRLILLLVSGYTRAMYREGDGHKMREVPRPLGRIIASLLVVGVVLGISVGGCAPRVIVQQRPTFAELSDALSEAGGYFPSDNLVSNESGYQKVLNKLDELQVRGGVYIGVGPEQNFTYIAALRPARALILDIRRDNRLQHLLYKALFVLARNRAEFLSLLYSRPLEKSAGPWETASITDLVAAVDRAQPSPTLFQATLKRVFEYLEKRLQFPLTPHDRERIEDIFQSFYASGLDIRYETYSRRSWRTFPTLRELLLETDLSGRQRSFLASEESFQFLKQLQERDLIIPVTGDFAGPKALRAIGDYLRQMGETVSVFYTSNVEYYLLQQDALAAFAENVRALPRDERSLIIRSFVGFGYQHPEALPGYYITTLLQYMENFLRHHDAGDYRSYYELGVVDYIPLKVAGRRSSTTVPH